MPTPDLNPHSRSKQIQSPLFQAVLLIIAIVIFWWFILSPKYNQVSTKRAELASVQSQQSSLENDQEELNKLIDKLESSDAQIKLLDEALPLSNRPTQIALLLETYAQSSGMSISDISVDDLDHAIAAGNKSVIDDPYGKQRGLVTVKVTMVVTGSVDQFKNFLEILEKSGRIVDVENLEVTSGDGAARFTLDLKTYAFEPK